MKQTTCPKKKNEEEMDFEHELAEDELPVTNTEVEDKNQEPMDTEQGYFPAEDNTTGEELKMEMGKLDRWLIKERKM